MVATYFQQQLHKKWNTIVILMRRILWLFDPIALDGLRLVWVNLFIIESYMIIEVVVDLDAPHSVMWYDNNF